MESVGLPSNLRWIIKTQRESLTNFSNKYLVKNKQKKFPSFREIKDPES